MNPIAEKMAGCLMGINMRDWDAILTDLLIQSCQLQHVEHDANPAEIMARIATNVVAVVTKQYPRATMPVWLARVGRENYEEEICAFSSRTKALDYAHSFVTAVWTAEDGKLPEGKQQAVDELNRIERQPDGRFAWVELYTLDEETTWENPD